MDFQNTRVVPSVSKAVESQVGPQGNFFLGPASSQCHHHACHPAAGATPLTCGVQAGVPLGQGPREHTVHRRRQFTCLQPLLLTLRALGLHACLPRCFSAQETTQVREGRVDELASEQVGGLADRDTSESRAN